MRYAQSLLLLAAGTIIAAIGYENHELIGLAIGVSTQLVALVYASLTNA